MPCLWLPMPPRPCCTASRPHRPCAQPPVAPDDVAVAPPRLQPLLDHALHLRLDQIGERIAGDIARPWARSNASISSRGRPPRNGSRSPTAAYSGLVRAFSWHPGWAPATRSLPSSTAPSTTTSRAARPQHAEPFVDRRFGMRQGPQHMAADHQVEARRRERQLLGVGLLEADCKAALRRLAFGAREHRRGKVDAGHAMPARGQLETEKAGAGADVERVECALRAAGRGRRCGPTPRARPRCGCCARNPRRNAPPAGPNGRRPAALTGSECSDDIGWPFSERAQVNPTTAASASTCSA